MMYRKHLQRLSGSLVMSSFMSVALTGVFSFLELGFSWMWLQVWGQGVLIAFPTAFTLDMVFGSRLRLLSGELADRAASAWS